MKILVTGANGMLGQDMADAVLNSNHKLVISKREDLNITDLRECKEFIKLNNPDLIINCAAYTDVDGAEKQVKEAYAVNDLGAKNLAIASNVNCSKLIYISSDYVFDGKTKHAYKENDSPKPISVYGKSKYWGEISTKEYSARPYIIRTSWLYGKHGKNFVDKIITSDKNKLKVVNDQFGSPTSTKALSSAIIKFIDMKMSYGTYHLSSEGYCSWYDLSQAVVEICDLDKEIYPCSTEEFETLATRPKFSVMTSTKNTPSMPNWKKDLIDYLS
jgi:dTDP-4-dehydrorhamnose reductase